MPLSRRDDELAGVLLLMHVLLKELQCMPSATRDVAEAAQQIIAYNTRALELVAQPQDLGEGASAAPLPPPRLEEPADIAPFIPGPAVVAPLVPPPAAAAPPPPPGLTLAPSGSDKPQQRPRARPQQRQPAGADAPSPADAVADVTQSLSNLRADAGTSPPHAGAPCENGAASSASSASAAPAAGAAEASGALPPWLERRVRQTAAPAPTPALTSNDFPSLGGGVATAPASGAWSRSGPQVRAIGAACVAPRVVARAVA
jgi:hypothetical protein